MHAPLSRVTAAYRGVAIVMLNCVVLAVLLELSAAATEWLLPATSAAHPAAWGMAEASPYYAHKPWAPDFWREHWSAVLLYAYQPYTVWRVGDFAGRYVNVGRDHLRRTPGSHCAGDQERVFVFGGSTIWGWGSPDSSTIPARLQFHLASGSTEACVQNHGQLGFVSTQERIGLEQQLARGNIPTLAVFYDGFNDCSPVQLGYGPGAHWYLDSIAQRLDNAANVTSAWRAGSVASMVRGTNTFALASRLTRIGTRHTGAQTWTAPAARWPADSINRLAEAAASVYLANVRIIDGLAKEFGFEYQIFIQPWIRATTAPEQAGGMRIAPLTDGGLCARYYELLRASLRGHPHVHDLSAVFDVTTAAEFIDRVHLTPDGNDQVARLISRVVVPNMSRRRRRPSPRRIGPRGHPPAWPATTAFQAPPLPRARNLSRALLCPTPIA